MKEIRVVVGSLLLIMCLIGWWLGQKDEECISDYFELENALLSKPANRYQILKGYLLLKYETGPACVTSYYYIGMNSIDIVKQNCPTDIKPDKDEMLTGCSKWKWCINSFYMGLDLDQLQDFSFDSSSEVQLELPPVCNINECDLIEYLLRITMSVSYVNS